MAIKNTVYEHRKSLEMTQEDLARSCDVTRQTIIAIEKGNYTPSVALALQLAHTLHSSVESLFTYET